MSHKPNKLDIITDLRRAISASFSPLKLNDENSKVFLKKAEENLKKVNLNSQTLKLIKIRLEKAKDPNNSIHKRREDLLTASSLLLS